MRTDFTFDPRKQRALPIWVLILAVLLIVARIVSSHYPATVENDADLVHWIPIHQAAGIAHGTHRPVFYEFSAAWCAPCRTMEHEIFMNPEFASRINARFVPVKVIDTEREEGRNAPEVQALMDRYGVNGFPTVVVARDDGSVIDRVVGYPGPDKMAYLIDHSR